MDTKIVDNEQWNKIFNILLDHSVSEVEVNGPDGVFIKKKGKRIHLPYVTFDSEKDYMDSINEAIVPFVDSMTDFDPNGYIFEGRLLYESKGIEVQARCHIMLPPVCDTPQITMAKRSKTLTTLSSLAGMGSMSTEMLHFLEMCAKANLTVVFSGQSGAGKDLAGSTIIPTPHGFTTMEDVTIGDYVFNEVGKPAKVTNKYIPQKDQKYLLEFSNGEKIAAGEGHLWRVIDLQDDYVKENSYEVRIPLSLNNVSKLEVAKLTKDNYLTTEEFLELIDYTPVDKGNNLSTKGNIDPIVNMVKNFEMDAGQVFALTVRSVLDANKPLFSTNKNKKVAQVEELLRQWDREEISFNELFELCNKDVTLFSSLTSVSELLGKKIVNKREVADFLLKDHYKRIEIRKEMNANVNPYLAYKNLTTREMFNQMYNSDSDTDNDSSNFNNMFKTMVDNISNSFNSGEISTNHVNFAVEKTTSPVVFNYNSSLPINPYVLGLWLGNPNSSDGRIIVTAKKEEIQEIKAKLTTSCDIDNKSVSIVDKEVDSNGDTVSTLRIKGFKQLLKKVYSGDKYGDIKNGFPKIIPDDYLFASVRDREELIAGIIDSEGSVDNDGNCAFIGLSRDIVEQLRTIVSSLGIRTSPIRVEERSVVKDNEEHQLPAGYKLSFLFDRNHFGLNKNILAMQDRLNDIATIGHNDQEDIVYITSIVEQDFEDEEFYCIEVDTPSHLFLAGETFIPTHNTTMLEAMTKLIPDNYRIGVAEDSPELNLIQENVTYLHSVPWAPKMSENDVATLQWVVSQFQRNRCDKLIIGETRGKEFGDFLIAANSGMEGSMTTIHANDTRQCLTKMSNFAMKAADKQPIRAINTDIASAIDIIVQLVVIDGKHRVSNIAEIIPVLGQGEEATITMSNLYEWDRQEDLFYKKIQISDHLRRILDERGINYQEFISSQLDKRFKHHNYGKSSDAHDFGSNSVVDEDKIINNATSNNGFNRIGTKRKQGLPTRRTI